MTERTTAPDVLSPGGETPQATARPVRLGGAVLHQHRHVCAFFSSRDDEYRVLLPYIKDGVEAGEKAIHIVDPQRCDEHRRRLACDGIDEEQRRGQLDLRTWADAHLQGGAFDQDRTLRLVAAMRRDSRQQGFTRTRFVTHMEWALEPGGGIDALLEYEARANLGVPGDPVICVYDLARFGGDVVVDVMRTHPMILIGGVLHENPFFVPPDEFLRELRDRRRRGHPVTAPE